MNQDTCRIRWLPKLLGEISRAELWETFGALASAFDDTESLAVVQRSLRSFISEWIDSGFANDGSEYPLRRNFAPRAMATGAAADGPQPRNQGAVHIPHAVLAMAKCVKGRVQVHMPRSGEDKYIVFHDKTGDGYGKPPHMFIEPQGGFSYQRAFELEQPRACEADVNEKQETKAREEHLELVAAGLFMEFYQSEWRFRLMRCRRCDVFIIPTRKPRERYEYGWHCEKCRSAGTATARMLTVIKEHRQRWLSFAAEAWLRWRPENGERAVWIAEEVNKQLGRTEPRIRRNSITHNAVTIARMARELGSSAVTDRSRASRDNRPLPANW